MAARDAVRMCARPPARFAAGADFTLWITRFEMYAGEAEIPAEKWTKELLSLLEDEPFRTAQQLGLKDSQDYTTVKNSLQQQFAPDGNELEWQYRLQSRCQRADEQLAEFAGALRVLADKAYPKWSGEQRQELSRNQFVQGLRSATTQLQLMREMPNTLTEALTRACQLEAVESAQKRLHIEKHARETRALDIADGTSTQSCSTEHGRNIEPQVSPQVDELARLVRRLTEEVAKLRSTEADPMRPIRARRRQPTCWGCGAPGHVRRECPQQRTRERPQRDSRGRRQPPLN